MNLRKNLSRLVCLLLVIVCAILMPLSVLADDSQMSPADQAAIAALQKAYAEAVARGDMVAAQAYHDAAEAIRAKYGYSGGTDGSENITVKKKEPVVTYDESTDYDKLMANNSAAFYETKHR